MPTARKGKRVALMDSVAKPHVADHEQFPGAQLRPSNGGPAKNGSATATRQKFANKCAIVSPGGHNKRRHYNQCTQAINGNLGGGMPPHIALYIAMRRCIVCVCGLYLAPTTFCMRMITSWMFPSGLPRALLATGAFLGGNARTLDVGPEVPLQTTKSSTTRTKTLCRPTMGHE